MEPPAPPQPSGTSGSQTSEAGTASSSSGIGGKQLKSRNFPYTVTPTNIKDVDDLSIGHFMLTKPSDVSGSHVNQDTCLYILPTVDQFSLRILREINHPNILHLESVLDSKTPSSIHVLVESYYYCLRTEIIKYTTPLNRIKPEKVRSLIRQLIESIDELRANGLYHGNLNLDNTYFDKGTSLLKLGNFSEKEGNELIMSQREDWDAAGTMIKEIADILKSTKPDLDLTLMEDLSLFLRNPNLAIEQVKDAALNQVYFWDKRRRTSFFVHGVLGPLKNGQFRTRVEALDFISEDWNLNDHDGVLTAMNNRRLKDHLLVYSGSRVHYVQFVSGAYTHEAELIRDEKINESVVVDNLIPPRLCLELVRIAGELGLHIC